MTEENTNPEPKQETTDETMTVDLWDAKVELPKEIAKQVIAVRDAKTKEYNEVNEQLTSIRAAEEAAKLKAAEAERKAQALEAMKNDDVDKAKELLSAEYQQKIAKYEAHQFKLAVENVVAKREDLIDGAAADVVGQVIAQNQFKLNDDFTVTNADGKTVEQLVSDYVDSRSYLKIATGNKPMGTPRKTDAPQTKSADEKFKAGLDKLING